MSAFHLNGVCQGPRKELIDLNFVTAYYNTHKSPMVKWYYVKWMAYSMSVRRD